MISWFPSVRSSILLTALLVQACEVPFSPKGEFRNAIAVYGILSDRSDSLYVRVYRTYDPAAYDPLEHVTEEPIRNAVVEISDGSSNSVLNELTVVRYDTTRYTDSVLVYAAASIPIRKAATYSLTVQPAGEPSVSAVATTPARGIIEVVNPSILVNPSSSSSPVQIRAVVSSGARGFRVRGFIRFEVFDQAQWNPHVRELPREIQQPNTPSERWAYHNLSRRTSDGGESQEVVSFFNDAYQRGLSAMRQEFAGKTIRWVDAVFVLAQVDLHLYNYYNIANAFRDPYSTRVDQPDYTNIQGGVGVFGSIVHDSTIFTFPLNTTF